MNNDNTIVLIDEDGQPVRFEFLDLLEYRGEEYVVLIPEEESEEADEVVILKVEHTNDEEDSYVGVEDERLLDRIFAVFKERNKDEFNFI